MKRSHKIAAAVTAALGLGLAAAAFAHPEGKDMPMGQGMSGQGMMGHGTMEKMHGAKTPEERQEEVARTGAAVMPFDLMRSTHFFDDTSSGGIESITAHDPSDQHQVALIRSHLAAEAERFGKGDFSDPAAIHGHDMPGLAELAHAGDRLEVGYKNLPAGASLSFKSRDASVIAAVHGWFAAQRSDHAAHAHMH